MSKQTKFKKYNLLGVEIDAASRQQAVEHITELASAGRGSHYVVKPYVEFIDRAAGDSAIRELLNRAELCLPDGIALLWAAAYLYDGKPGLGRLLKTLFGIIVRPGSVRHLIPEPTSGINFTWPLLEACSKQKLSVYLIGSPKTQTITDTAKFINRRLPDLNIAGHFVGRLSAQLKFQLIRQLEDLRPDVILIGMGFPRQEQLMAELSPQLDHGVLIGEGGTFDYKEFGGRRTKAPRFIQSIGLEWLWRLLLEPWRLKRQLAIPRFIWRVYRAGQGS